MPRKQHAEAWAICLEGEPLIGLIDSTRKALVAEWNRDLGGPDFPWSKARRAGLYSIRRVRVTPL